MASRKPIRKSASRPLTDSMRRSRHEEIEAAARSLLNAVIHHGGTLRKQEVAAISWLDRALRIPWGDDRCMWCGSRLTSSEMRRLHMWIARVSDEQDRANRQDAVAEKFHPRPVLVSAPLRGRKRRKVRK